LNELTRIGPFGAIQPRQNTEFAVVNRDDMVWRAGLMVQEGRRRKTISMGPYLLALSREAAAALSIPPGVKVCELDSFDFGDCKLVVDGVIGLHFSDRLRGDKMGLIDLNNFIAQ